MLWLGLETKLSSLKGKHKYVVWAGQLLKGPDYPEERKRRFLRLFFSF